MNTKKLDLVPDQFIPSLLASAPTDGLCIVDSCGVASAGSNLFVAGMFPCESYEISSPDVSGTFKVIDEMLSGRRAAIFTISYDFGRKLENVGESPRTALEPDLFISTYDCLLAHNYASGETVLTGNADRFGDVLDVIRRPSENRNEDTISLQAPSVTSNFTKPDYLKAIETIKQHIRAGDTYQTNLTQQMTVSLPETLSTATVFERILHRFPVPHAAYIHRKDSLVISASPERFFRVQRGLIETSPIKGTRPRGCSPDEDARLREELLASTKDRAENVMIVDLLRNDLGRVCEYGSVRVTELCSVQELPTLFHLVSNVNGTLKAGVRPSEIIRSLFPCGSITGAPKISTMRIIDEIETRDRGLSMGAIGMYIPEGFGLPSTLDLSVAIRTMVIRDSLATFNVGGGIVIDSDPESEYLESLLKAKALLGALGADFQLDRELLAAGAV